jgi:hypothetical protein
MDGANTAVSAPANLLASESVCAVEATVKVEVNVRIALLHIGCRPILAGIA